MKNQILKAVKYLYSLNTNSRDINIKEKDSKVYGYTFYKLDWDKLNLDKVEQYLEGTIWDMMYAEGTDISPRTKETDKDGNTLKNTYIYIGKDFRNAKSEKDLTEVNLDIS